MKVIFWLLSPARVDGLVAVVLRGAWSWDLKRRFLFLYIFAATVSAKFRALCVLCNFADIGVVLSELCDLHGAYA